MDEFAPLSVFRMRMFLWIEGGARFDLFIF